MNTSLTAITATAIVSLLAAGSVMAEDKVNAKQRIEVTASPEAVWEKVGEFCSIEVWHPAVAKCELSDASGDTIRSLTLADGAQIVEKLVGQGETETSYQYMILEGPLPVKGYVANFEVKADDDGGAGIKWTAEFEADGVSGEEAQALIEGIFSAGLDELKAMN